MEIKDSGTRREFTTGAVRDITEGKGRCDLLPLGIIGKRFDDAVLVCVETYIRSGDTFYLWTALNRFIDKAQMGWGTALLEVAKHYEEGATKYSERNWEKGILLHSYIDSAIRHYIKFSRGDDDEPHDRAFMWNMLCAIWTHENLPEMIDLPFKGGENYEK